MSHLLKVGEAKEQYLTEEDCWRYTQRFLMHAKYTTTYKFILMKALLESIVESSDSGRLSYIQITKHIAKIYWNLTILYGLNQLNSKNTKSGINKVLEQFKEKHSIPNTFSFDKIPDSQKDELYREINLIFKKNVYGSFYGSFDNTIYSFNNKEEWLQLAPRYIVFFEKYKRILMNLTNFQLALFLEKFNERDSLQNILHKVEFVSTRQSLIEFQQLLVQYGETSCFYCKKSLVKIHVDHFIPWSYVQNDVLWNFVLACPSCNSSKNDKLAHQLYLNNLIERNNLWLPYDEMHTYSDNKLLKMYDYAIINGFDSEWQPKL